jgi:hypothetical protein
MKLKIDPLPPGERIEVRGMGQSGRDLMLHYFY